MNGKFILLFTVCINIISLLLSFGCADVTTGCSIGSNFILEMFVSESSINAQLDQSGGFGFNDSFNDAVGDLTEPESSGITNVISVIIDGLLMVLGIVSLMTPAPIIAFMMSLSFPLWINLLVSVPIIILYVMSIAEFVRGSQF